MAGKLWRSRGRFLLSNLILFGLGVMTCLICLQMFAASGINDPIVYTNPEEYRLALQMNQQPAPPLLTEENGNNNGIKAGAGDDSSAVLCAPNSGVASGRNNNEATSHDKRGGNNKNLQSSQHKFNNNNNNNDLTVSQQEADLQHFEGVALPNNNDNNVLSPNDILMNKDLLLQEENNAEGAPGPTVWVVTPTFYRPEQKPELTRVAQALLPVSDFVHWIVVEDTSKGTDTSFDELKKFLQRFPLAVTILKSLPPKTRIVGKPRGVGGRTAAIEWLRENAQEGVVYFADDDNTYDSSIFKQMQTTEKVTMWPVGLVTDLGVSSPIVKNGRVVGFYDGWNGQRKFPVDMAGFAINLKLFLDNPKASMPWKAGYEEDELLQNLGITMKDIKPLASNCTEILVWHTKAMKNVWPKKPKNLSPSVAANTNLHILLKQLPHNTSSGSGDRKKSDSGFSFLRIFFGNGL